MEILKEQLETLKKEVKNFEENTDLLEAIAPALENPGELSFKHHRALVTALEDSLKKFEVLHPRLVDEVKVIINSLNDIGI